jgi:hypothetical protein
MTLADLESFVADCHAAGIAPEQEIVLRHKGSFEGLRAGRVVPMYDVLFDDGETERTTQEDLPHMKIQKDYVSHKAVRPIVFLSTGR